jgi:colanic acid biosynthesis glycosyl transferase WcaI
LSQGLEVILAAADHLRDREEIVFLIVGQGACRDGLIAEAESRGLENVRFLPLQPESELPLLYASCDVGLIPLRRGMSENSVPCKTYSVMAASRPFVAGVDAGGNVWKLTETVGCGVCVGPDDGMGLAEAVVRLQSEPAVAEAMGRNGREYVMRHFARDVVTNRYRIALESVIEKQSLPVGESAPSASLSSD